MLLAGLSVLAAFIPPVRHSDGEPTEITSKETVEFTLVAGQPDAGLPVDRSFVWRAPEACTAWIWCRSVDTDPALEIERTGQPSITDDNGGDGSSAWVRLEVAEAELLSIHVRALPGRCELRVGLTLETDATREMHDRAKVEIERSQSEAGRSDPSARIERLAAITTALLEADPEGRSLLIANDLWTLAGALYDEGVLDLPLRVYDRLYAHRARIYPRENRYFQIVRVQQALILQDLGEVEQSVEIKRDALAVLERALPAQARLLLIVRMNLAAGLGLLGRLDEAIEQCRAILAVDVTHLRSDDPMRTVVRTNLGELLTRRGDLRGARDLHEATLREAIDVLGEESVEVEGLRLNLAVLCSRIGECERAEVLVESAIANMKRRLAPDSMNLLFGRMREAAVLSKCGEPTAARHLAEEILAALGDRLAPDDREVIRIHQLVAATFAEQGEFLEARDRMEVQLGLLELQPPDGTTDLDAQRVDLSNVLAALGDSQGARALLELAIAGLETKLPPGHPTLAVARFNLASELKRQGDAVGCLEMEEGVFDALDEISDPGGLLRTRLQVNMASTRQELGQVEDAEVLLSEALETLTRESAPQPEFAHVARFNLAGLHLSNGNLAGAQWLLEQDLAAAAANGEHVDIGAIQTRVMLASVHARGCQLEPLTAQARVILAEIEDLANTSLSKLSVREADNLARALRTPLQGLVGCMGMCPLPSLDAEVLRIDQLLREIPIARAESLRRALDAERGGDTGQRIAAFATRITQIAREPDSGAELASLVLERARLEREILDSHAARSVSSSPRIDLDCVRERLGPKGACVSFLTIHEEAPGHSARNPAKQQRLLAFVLRANGPPSRIDLGPADPIEAAVEGWRAAIGVAAFARGLGTPTAAPTESPLHVAGARLRSLVLDPLAEALDGARTVHMTLDGMLTRVPWDALPDGLEDDDCVVGDRWTIELHESLMELCEPALELDTDARLVAVGDVEYGAAGFDLEPGAAIWAARAGASIPEFPALPATRVELEHLSGIWPGSDENLLVLTGAHASESLLRAAAPGARFLHLATHGWTAPESLVRAADEARIRDGLASMPESVRDRARLQLCPLSFCGLALAGIAAGADAEGGRVGALEGEELASWDLSHCALAVFSACETALGTYQTGRAADGLQRAARIAGARQVLCSLWPVPDGATSELMNAFYFGMWKQGLSPGRALWRAKCALREQVDARGLPVHRLRDWAGWTLWGPAP